MNEDEDEELEARITRLEQMNKERKLKVEARELAAREKGLGINGKAPEPGAGWPTYTADDFAKGRYDPKALATGHYKYAESDAPDAPTVLASTPRPDLTPGDDGIIHCSPDDLSKGRISTADVLAGKVICDRDD
jgi:hypothetical protein